MSVLSSFSQLTATYRWMLAAACVFNLGFYMLIPFLAGYLKQDLLLSATLVGVVLGVRSFCQQGLFLVGGLVADLMGAKLPIVVGCVLRAVGFGLFLFSEQTLVLFLAAFLTGFAGALFTPAAQAFFAKQEAISSTQMFSLVAIARNAGELLGPVCGVLLLSISFDLLCLIAALPFALFAVVFYLLLPNKTASASTTATEKTEQNQQNASIANTIRTVLSNKAFLTFSAVMSGYFMLINQISFAIPIHLVASSGTPQDIAWIMTLCAVVAIALQFPVTKACERRLTPQHWISIGIALMGLSFSTLILDWPYRDGLLALLPLCVLAIVFTLGTLVSFPFIMSQIALLAHNKSVATHYGFFYLFAGLGLIAGSSLVGLAFDLSHRSEHLAWYSLLVIGFGTSLLNMLFMSSKSQPEAAQPIKSSIIK
ncbi:MFS transporter [Pseudoalteromonas fenneropenaei]|uniref:MFS transporter n=1 Tax=Pseudoalteromonas fenneropenaei TaxID=1737459 RepID=A0ABV7CJC2_9GAMM